MNASVLSLALRRAFRLTGFIALWMIALTPVTVRAQAGDFGVIAGQVVNEATNAPLSGALIVLEGDARVTAVSGSDGRFRLTNVPAGPRTLVVSYTGLDTAKTEVAVPAGSSVQSTVYLTSDVYKMEAFSVSTVREGQAMSINDQRMAANVKNVISTDAFGNVADTNLANVLTKIPGVTGVRDEGEDFRISVRGINPDLNSVSVDGTLLAGATTRGTDRSFEIDKVSTNSIESIEIIKSPTPDMDADSIGGKINLRTKSAFDRQGREITYSLAANHHLYYERTHPSGSITYSDVLGANRRLGFAFNASYSRTFSPVSSFRAGYLNPTLTAPALMNDFQTSEDDIQLDRIGVGLKVDFKLSDTTSLFFNSIYNNFDDNMTQHKQRVRSTNSAQIVELSELVTAFNNGQYEYEMEARRRTVKTGMVQIGGRSDWDKYLLEYDVSHSTSRGTEGRENLSLRVNGVGYRIDRSQHLYFPKVTKISGPDITDYDNAFVDTLDAQDKQAWDRVTAGQVNLTRKFDDGLLTDIKTGIRFRSQEKRQDRYEPRWRYFGADGIAGRVNGLSDDNLNRFRDTGRRVGPVYGRYSSPIWPDWLAMHQDIRANPQKYVFDEVRAYQTDRSADLTAGEDITAAYLQGNIKIGNFSALGGVRVERTETNGVSWARNVSLPVLSQYNRIAEISGGYTDTFPGLHLKYEPRPGLILRASASTSIGRPNFNELAPGFNVNVATQTVSQNNPDLAPQFSENYDLSAEYYLKSVGLVSASVFRKDLEGFIFSRQSVVGSGASNGFDGEFEGYILNTRTNGGWARVTGLELNYQQQLTFLPGLLNGFGVYGNLTALSTEGTYNGTVVLKDIAGFIKRSGNLGLSYIKHNYTIRLSANYEGDSMRGFNPDPARRNYMVSRTTVDFSVRYAYRPRLNFFVDFKNLFNEKEFQYTGLEHRTINNRIFGTRMTAGISGSF
jgi:iron complex outermembrane recepter protein